MGATKRKINETLKQLQNDRKNSKNNTAIARLALKGNIKIDFKNTKKLLNYNDKAYGYCRETRGIKNNSITCNDAEHFFLEPERQRIINKKRIRRGREGK